MTPIMTESATHFVGPLTLSGICGKAVVRDMFDPSYSGEVHVDLGSRVMHRADVAELGFAEPGSQM